MHITQHNYFLKQIEATCKVINTRNTMRILFNKKIIRLIKYISRCPFIKQPMRKCVTLSACLTLCLRQKKPHQTIPISLALEVSGTVWH